jgi:hypothetical protein
MLLRLPAVFVFLHIFTRLFAFQRELGYMSVREQLQGEAEVAGIFSILSS